MKITDENFNVGYLLGGIEQIKTEFKDAGFDPDKVFIEIRVPVASNDQMIDVGTLLRRTEKFLGITAGANQSFIRLSDNLEGYTITNEKGSEN